TFFEIPSIYKTDERGEKIQVLQTICRKPLTGNSKSCVVTVADSSIPTTPCCLASAFPRQHPVLLSSIGGCCLENDFAVYHRRYLICIRFCFVSSDFSHLLL